VDRRVCDNRRDVRGCFPGAIFHTLHAGNLHSSHLVDIHLRNFQEDICRKLKFDVFLLISFFPVTCD